MKINGRWKINHFDVGYVGDTMLFDFISKNQRFIGLDPMNYIFITHFNEFDEPCGVNFIDVDYDLLVSEYSTIIIVGEAEVDEDFIIAFEMEKISDVNTILMTHPKGIRLLTKGKKCTEDIEVVPTFMENVEITINNLYPTLEGSFSIEYSAYENNELKHIIVDHVNDESVTIKVAKDSFFVIYSTTASINPYLICYDDSVALFQTVHNDYGEGVGEILCGGFVKNSGVVYFEEP